MPRRKTVVNMKKKGTGWEPFIFGEEKELLETQRNVRRCRGSSPETAVYSKNATPAGGGEHLAGQTGLNVSVKTKQQQQNRH